MARFMPPNKAQEARHSSFFCDAVFKASDEENIIEGIASTFKEDLEGDIIHPGSFTKTLKERVPAGRVPFFNSHRNTCEAVLGTVISAKETPEGLFFRAKLSLAASVQDIKAKMIEGHLKFLSIGFQTLKQDFTEAVVHGRRVFTRHIREVRLWEISLVPIPVNEGTGITHIKGLLGGLSLDDVFLDALCGQKNEQNLETAIKGLAAHLDPEQIQSIFDNLLKKDVSTLTESDKPVSVEPQNALTGQPLSDLTRRLRLLQLGFLGVNP